MFASGVYARHTSFRMPPKSTLPRRRPRFSSSSTLMIFPGIARHILTSLRNNQQEPLTQRIRHCLVALDDALYTAQCRTHDHSSYHRVTRLLSIYWLADSTSHRTRRANSGKRDSISGDNSRPTSWTEAMEIANSTTSIG